MKHLLNYYNYIVENLNKKYSGVFINNYKNWNIYYSDRTGHYITDKLVTRKGSISNDPVGEINKLVKKLVDYLDDNNYSKDYLNWGVRFKNKKYYVIFEINTITKMIVLSTIRSLDMDLRRDTIKINI
jgi:hypothetical protein